MTKRNIIVSIGLALLLVGCMSTSRTIYNTLASVEATTTGAYGGYLNLVVQGKLPTNSVPAISKDYNIFQATWTAAVMIAQWNTNAVAPQPVLDASAKVLTGINIAKGQ